MGRERLETVTACPTTGKLVVGAIDAKGKPLYGVTITAKPAEGAQHSAHTTGHRGPAVASFGPVPAGRYRVFFDRAEATARTVDVRAFNKHSRRNPNLVLQWKVRARLLEATPAELRPGTDELDVRYRIDDPDGVVLEAHIEIRDKTGTLVQRTKVAEAAGEHAVAKLWDATGATIDNGPYRVCLLVRDPLTTHRSERTVRVLEASIEVTVLDCFSHRPIRGAEVLFGVEDAEGEGSFVAEGDTYAIVRRAETNRHGVALLDHLEGYVSEFHKVRVRAEGYHAPDSVDADTVYESATLRKGERTEQEITVLSEDPPIPSDLGTTVSGLLASLNGIRVVVEQGPNFGNQSAALALLRNLRRVGYTGPIEVHADAAPTMFDVEYGIEVNCSTAPGQHGADIVALVRGRLAHRYGAALTVDGETSRDSGGGMSGTIGGGTIDATVRYPAQVYFEEDRAALAGALGAIAPPTSVTVDTEDPVPNLVVANAVVHTKKWQIIVKLKIISLSEPSVTSKLARLDPGYRNADPGVTWRDGPRFAANADDPKVIGMVAGGEFSKGGMQALRAGTLKTHSILALQPFWWHPSTRLLAVEGQEVESLCLPHAATYRQDPLALAPQARTELLTRECGAAAPGLQAIIAAVEAGTLDLMVVYGVHQAHYSSTATLVHNLAASVRSGQVSGRIRRAVMVIVCKVPVFGHLPVDARIETNACDAGLNAAVTGLGAAPAELLVVHPGGSLPSDVFQTLCEVSNLPMILEGANTANLMQMLGHPYLSVASKTTPYLDIPTDGADGHERLAELEALLNEGALDAEGAGELGTYFGAARDPTTVLDGYFAKLKSYVRGVPRDQVSLGLYKLAKALG